MKLISTALALFIIVTVTNAQSVYIGGTHTLILRNDSLFGSGSNYQYQLGLDTTGLTKFKLIETEVDAADVSDTYSVIIKNETPYIAGVYLGDTFKTFAPITGSPPIIAITAGQKHIAMIDTSFNVWTMGVNGAGQLGTGQTIWHTQHTPIQLLSISSVVLLKSFENGIIAQTAGGQIYSWGNNEFGQTGCDLHLYRLMIPTLTTWPMMENFDAGRVHSVGVSDGYIYGCGSGQNYQLANFALSNVFRVVRLGYVCNPAIMAAAGNTFSQVLLDNNKLIEFGATPNINDYIPDVVANGVDKVWAGYNSSFISVGGVIKARGDNIGGQLGLGDLSDNTSYYPVQFETSNVCLTPEGNNATVLLNSAVIAWDVVTGADTYNVQYRNLNTNEFFNVITQNNSITVTVAPDTYQYRVRAKCGALVSAFIYGGFGVNIMRQGLTDIMGRTGKGGHYYSIINK